MYLKRIGLVIILMINSSSCFALFVKDTISIQHTCIHNSDQEFYLSANVVNGNGVLISKNIFIDCDKFEFTGTIRCDGFCTIQSKKKFDPAMFKKEGTGIFMINETTTEDIININDIRCADEVNLFARIFKGNGILEANTIMIDCNVFQFTGIIRCDGICRINARSKLDSKMFKREGEGTFEIITNFDGESHFESHTQHLKFHDWLLVLLDDISLTQEQKKKFFSWVTEAVTDLLDKADPLCEQSDEAGKKAREKFIQEYIELMISGLKKVGVPSKKLSLARMRINEVVRKQISEHVS